MSELEKIGASIPKEAWNSLVTTACTTFIKLIYPLTATTEGIGRLIERQFRSLEEEQQVLAAKCLQEAAQKVKNSGRAQERIVIKPLVVYEALGNTDSQTDETIRSLWANLLANEFLDGDVHPELAKMLGKITSRDALLLQEIAQGDQLPLSVTVLKILASTYTLGLLNNTKKTFSHVHLEKLGLIQRIENMWCLTTAGREFMRCVSDPEARH